MSNANINAENRQVLINAQYVKDLSFENPHAPMSLATGQRPKIDISIDVNVKAMQPNVYEIALHIQSKAKGEDKELFIADLTYAGIFTVVNIPEEEKEYLLMVYCPNMLFPFARRIIADASRDGGFPPLMIDPIDFGALYQKRIQDDMKKQAAN